MVERASAAVRETSQVNRPVQNVFVGCNLPKGLELQLYEMRDQPETTPTGTRTVKRAFKTGHPIRVRGNAVPFGMTANYQITAGYAITQVPREFWERWCEQNHDSALLENRGLIAGADLEEIQAKAMECRQDKVKSGLERIDPKKPPSVGGGLKVTQATDDYS